MPSADTTAAGTTIISADSDNTASVSSDVAPSAHATAAVCDDSDNTASVSNDVAPSAHATAAVSYDSDDNIASVSSKVAPLMPPLLEQPSSPTTATTRVIWW